MNILAIGNSFSMDAARYFHQIAAADGYALKIVNLYIGGCSLETHSRNMEQNNPAYVYQLNGKEEGPMISIREALKSDVWDIVTLQQASSLSIDPNSYRPYIRLLSGYVKKYAPGARQWLHQTWAYEQGCERLTKELGYSDQYDMFLDIQAANSIIAAELGGLPLILSGEAFQNAIRCKITGLHCDTYHASHGIGRYILALLWYETLTGNRIDDNTFHQFDEPVSPEDIRKAKQSVRMTLDKPHTIIT